jgi:hypothetical protein
MKNHPFQNGCVAGPDQPIGSLQFDHTDPARPCWNKIFVMTECRDGDPGFFRSLKNRHPPVAFHFFGIYLNFQGLHLHHRSFFRRPILVTRWTIAHEGLFPSWIGDWPDHIQTRPVTEGKRFPVPRSPLLVGVGIAIEKAEKTTPIPTNDFNGERGTRNAKIKKAQGRLTPGPFACSIGIETRVCRLLWYR